MIPRHLTLALLGSAMLAACSSIAARPALPAAPQPPAAPRFADTAQAVPYSLTELPYSATASIDLPALNLFPQPFGAGDMALDGTVSRPDGLYAESVFPIRERYYPASADNLQYKAVQTSDLGTPPLYLREIALAWNGLIPVHRYILRPESKEVAVEINLKALTLTANQWPALAVGATFAYSASYSYRQPGIGRSTMAQTGYCTVVRSDEQITPSLPGTTYAIECVSRFQDDPGESIERYAYNTHHAILWPARSVKDDIISTNTVRRYQPQ